MMLHNPYSHETTRCRTLPILHTPIPLNLLGQRNQASRAQRQLATPAPSTAPAPVSIASIPPRRDAAVSPAAAVTVTITIPIPITISRPGPLPVSSISRAIARAVSIAVSVSPVSISVPITIAIPVSGAVSVLVPLAIFAARATPTPLVIPGQVVRPLSVSAGGHVPINFIQVAPAFRLGRAIPCASLIVNPGDRHALLPSLALRGKIRLGFLFALADLHHLGGLLFVLVAFQPGSRSHHRRKVSRARPALAIALRGLSVRRAISARARAAAVTADRLAPVRPWRPASAGPGAGTRLVSAVGPHVRTAAVSAIVASP